MIVTYLNLINLQIHRHLRGLFALHAEAHTVQGWRGERRSGGGHIAVAGCAVQNQRQARAAAGRKLPHAVGAERNDEARALNLFCRDQ